ncbi:hypothetical protein J6590_005187 [Homalodisca vitripennis]|nr:hypothetical protein J6590_005187 [Homalodisca vitripennis]
MSPSPISTIDRVCSRGNGGMGTEIHERADRGVDQQCSLRQTARQWRFPLPRPLYTVASAGVQYCVTCAVTLCQTRLAALMWWQSLDVIGCGDTLTPGQSQRHSFASALYFAHG